MAKKIEVLGVYLEAEGTSARVGSLIRDTGSMIHFDIDQSYIDLGQNRPILSSALLHIGDEAKTVQQLRSGPMLSGGRDLPPWFLNLLPEGALRELVNRELPTGKTSNFDVLNWLGEDLPGAVVIRAEGALDSGFQRVRETRGDQTLIRFSLAGVQLKMSMLKQGGRLTFPATGRNGDIIAKLPSEKFPYLPEVEYTSMKLAEAVGVTVPSFELLPTESVYGIKEEFLQAGSQVLAVNRFDRTDDGMRVHMEDFSQVMGVSGDQKYFAANEETVLNIATRLGEGGTKPFLQAAKRVAVNLLLGNNDAHLKNWSLWYPVPTRGELSPAYDIVAAYVYDHSNEMALKFRNSRNSEIIGLNRFERAAELCGIPTQRAKKEIVETVEQAADEWPTLIRDLPMPQDYRDKLLERTAKLALTNEVGVTFMSDRKYAC
ncbi:type II toxin-antitoxin system HipA family toxin [Mesorhizobium sp. LjRoot246]|uniref:type II toxin-antitoxin system HipA family toxin n=1 Tax=Mesorhizobium sp. LjRoot246 TaxID=3342294 RepID=UPI003ED05FCD